MYSFLINKPAQLIFKCMHEMSMIEREKASQKIEWKMFGILDYQVISLMQRDLEFISVDCTILHIYCSIDALKLHV